MLTICKFGTGSLCTHTVSSTVLKLDLNGVVAQSILDLGPVYKQVG